MQGGGILRLPKLSAGSHIPKLTGVFRSSSRGPWPHALFITYPQSRPLRRPSPRAGELRRR